MHERSRNAEDWADFYARAYGFGVRKLHCSREYESYALLLRTLEVLASRYRDVHFDFMVKLAAPTFDEPGFEPGDLSARVATYISDLGTDCLADLQWMWRADLKDDSGRCRDFVKSLNLIDCSVASLKRQQLVRRFLCFPYSHSFAKLAVEASCVDGIVVYRNPIELEFEDLVARCDETGKAAIAIRPFAGGQLLKDRAMSARDLIGFSAMNPHIDGVVTTVSTYDHLRTLVSQ